MRKCFFILLVSFISVGCSMIYCPNLGRKIQKAKRGEKGILPYYVRSHSDSLSISAGLLGKIQNIGLRLTLRDSIVIVTDRLTNTQVVIIKTLEGQKKIYDSDRCDTVSKRKLEEGYEMVRNNIFVLQDFNKKISEVVKSSGYGEINQEKLSAALNEYLSKTTIK